MPYVYNKHNIIMLNITHICMYNMLCIYLGQEDELLCTHLHVESANI